MKAKKIFSILLVLVMLSTMSIYASAENITYTANGSYTIKADQTLNPETFEVVAHVDDSKFSVLDGGSKEYTYEIISLTATYVDLTSEKLVADYIADPEAFFEVFAKKEADVEYAKQYNADKEDNQKISVGVIYLDSVFNISFADPNVFGVLDYTLEITGFSAPLSTGVGIFDDVVSEGKLPIDITIEGNISEFPTITSHDLLGAPTKKDYFDSEKFDATGLKVLITTTTGSVGTYTYNEETAHMFSFNPSINEKLTTYDSEVIAYVNGLEVNKTPITVTHKWSDGPVNLTTGIYTDTNPGYHAIVCEGCGEAYDAQPHNPGSWEFNNDQTFLKDGTASTKCKDCGTVLTKNVHGTASYNQDLADYHFIRVILDYINLLLRFIGAATY